jgi:hypothetical protein
MEHSVKTLKPSTFQAVTLPVRDEHSWASDAGSQLGPWPRQQWQIGPVVRATCQLARVACVLLRCQWTSLIEVSSLLADV